MRVFVSGVALAAYLALPSTASAQQTVKLFDPVNITVSTIPSGLVPIDEAVDFGTKQVYLQCGAGDTASVIGTHANYGFILDDLLRVQGPTNQITNYCVPTSCFTLSDDPIWSVGQPAEAAYGPVDPVDISSSLVPGLGLYTFSRMDIGYTYTSSEMSLTTTCTVREQICHYDNGKKAFKTLTVGAAAIPAHLNAHPNDYLGACIP